MQENDLKIEEQNTEEQKAEEQNTKMQETGDKSDESKSLFLKYFPSPIKNQEVPEQDYNGGNRENVCIYCKSPYVQTNGRGIRNICNECSNHLLSEWREIVRSVRQIQADLEILLGIDSNVVISVKKQQMRWYVSGRDNSENREHWVRITRQGEKIVIRVRRGLPESLVMYRTAEYLINAFWELGLIRKGGEDETFQKEAFAKWYAVHYMYVSGYTEFAMQQDSGLREENGDKENGYAGITLELGSPLTDFRSVRAC